MLELLKVKELFSSTVLSNNKAHNYIIKYIKYEIELIKNVPD